MPPPTFVSSISVVDCSKNVDARFDSGFVVDNTSVSKVGVAIAPSMCVDGVRVASGNGNSQNCMDLEEGMTIDMGGSATGGWTFWNFVCEPP
ncbi:hypothetical protein V6N13_126469 [Hibiscus sabdariffa]|uniref:Uncharacterized protein n=1 Tax=Hibiscus sabdariffa TaxID=183260 RepID=A0ABR2RFE2_9ROSI